ncbi:hypothetical protein BKA70DRAFT_1223938 [Coprinopsis sp. MPI-PUGE-AT-0042]|nr:hypothetical protein BKA70DRAFT_1223938 [Coprinopsis sp. MPI-PUGE-AT-0042]
MTAFSLLRALWWLTCVELSTRSALPQGSILLKWYFTSPSLPDPRSHASSGYKVLVRSGKFWFSLVGQSNVGECIINASIDISNHIRVSLGIGIDARGAQQMNLGNGDPEGTGFREPPHGTYSTE